MQARDRIGKAVWNICESCKEIAATNIVQATRDGVIKLDEGQQQQVIQLVTASIDQAFHRAFNTFLKSVDSAVSEATKAAARDAGVPPT